MKSSHRIFLRTKEDIREFLWLERGNDGSLYLGATVPFSYGRKGKWRAEATDLHGTAFNIDDGETMSSPELAGKRSYHKSGIINLPTISADRRERLRMSALSDHDGAVPLLGVIPMIPTKYPVSGKNVRSSDLVIDCDLNNGHCLGVVLFMTKAGLPNELLGSLEKQELSVRMACVDMFEGKLCAMLYFGERFLGWPREQLEVMPHPDEAGAMVWPIVIPAYE